MSVPHNYLGSQHAAPQMDPMHRVWHPSLEILPLIDLK